MDFGLDSLRSIIEDFLSNSGGRRGREREQRRRQHGDETGASDGSQERDGVGEQATGETGGESSPESDSDGGGGGLFGRGSADDEDDIDDLYYRIEELEEELENKSTKLGSVRDSQQQVADRVEEMNDTVRQLLGVYDMLTDDVNPFTGEGEERNGFGVFGEDDPETRSERPNGGTAPRFELEDTAGPSDREETVSFDDLKGVIEDAAAARSDESDRGGDGGKTITFDEDDVDAAVDDDDDDTRVEVQATESVDGPDADESGGEGERDESDVTLETLADTYASDIIVLEWLTELVRTAGPAATLRAISYYAEIGWIDDEVREHLEAMLSGPDLDIHVDPGATPDELTAEDHADSYTYIMKLREIHETKREVEPDVETEA